MLIYQLDRHIPEGGRYVLRTLTEHGFVGAGVGGFVRDLARHVLDGDASSGLDAKDFDVTTDATTDDIQRIFQKTYVVGDGLRHGTIGVIAPDGSTYEVTTFRTDLVTDGRHAVIGAARTLEEDLARRDLTINAMALVLTGDEHVGEIVDPFAGLDDLNNGFIRAVGDPEARFREDFLRVPRAYRFAAKMGGTIDPATRAAMVQAAPGMTQLSRERIGEEIWKLLCQAKRPGAVEAAFRAMQEDGVLQHMVPELAACHGVTQNAYHAYDVFGHTLKAVEAMPADRPDLRLTMLLHDIGKPMTRVVNPRNGKVQFIEHDSIGADLADKLLKRLAFGKETRLPVVRRIALHMRLMQAVDEAGAVRPEAIRTLASLLGDGVTLQDMLAIRMADLEGSGIAEKRMNRATTKAIEAEFGPIERGEVAVKIGQLAVNGRDLLELGVPAGPRLGEILNRLLKIVLKRPDENTRERLILLARDMNRNLAQAERQKAEQASRTP